MLSVATNKNPEIHTTTTIRDTSAVLKRNLLTTALHSAATYLYDLDGFPGKAGWWGRPNEPSESSSIWATVKAAREIARDRLWRETNASLVPVEIALVVDDVSPAYFATAGGPIPPTDPDLGFSSVLHYMPAHELARTGAAFRTFLLSDLLLPSFQTEVLPSLKLIVFANALRIEPAVRSYIGTTLAQGGRTLLYIWAPNSIHEDSEGAVSFDASGPAAITGLPLVQGPGESSLQADISGFAFPYFGPSYGISPWFTLDGSPPGVSVLASYRSSKRPAVVKKSFGSHTVVFSGAVMLPTEVYTKIARAAGVHMLLTTASDVVDVGGTALMVVAGDPTLHAAREISLPRRFGAVIGASSGAYLGDANATSTQTVCKRCDGFKTAEMAPGDVSLFFLEEL